MTPCCPEAAFYPPRPPLGQKVGRGGGVGGGEPALLPGRRTPLGGGAGRLMTLENFFNWQFQVCLGEGVTSWEQPWAERPSVSDIDALCDLKPVSSFPGASVSPFVKQENGMLKNVYSPQF